MNADDEPEDLEESHESWAFVPKMLEIPEIFHSLEFDGPFDKCLICEYPLVGPSSDYMIERIFRGDEPIVEYAVCALCQEEANQQMSIASRQQVMQLFEAVDHEARLRRLVRHQNDEDVDAWIEHCLLTGKHRSECHGYQIISKCSNLEIEVGLLPVMLSDEAAKQISSLMSQQTRGFMDDFMDRFGMPPEFSADPEWTPVFL